MFGLLLSEYKRGTVKKKSGDMKCDNTGVFCVKMLTVQIIILPAPSLFEVQYLGYKEKNLIHTICVTTQLRTSASMAQSPCKIFLKN